jgi:hypothetical protein
MIQIWVIELNFKSKKKKNTMQAVFELQLFLVIALKMNMKPVGISSGERDSNLWGRFVFNLLRASIC